MTAVDGYLLDTSTLSAFFDTGHPKHAMVKAFVDGLPPGDMQFVSAIAIAELKFGAALYEAAEGHASPKVAGIIAGASSYVIRGITRHTGAEYGIIKAKVAFKYLKNPMDRKKDRTPWVEDWVDKYTGRALDINENDLWMCAQAKELNLVLLTIDKKMKRIVDADLTLRVKMIA